MVAMNFPLPSGSSPPLNPPGIMRICAWSIASASALMLSSMSGVEVPYDHYARPPPARANARAESYSQFVPGNTGMTTRGDATDAAGRAVFLEVYRL